MNLHDSDVDERDAEFLAAADGLLERVCQLYYLDVRRLPDGTLQCDGRLFDTPSSRYYMIMDELKKYEPLDADEARRIATDAPVDIDAVMRTIFAAIRAAAEVGKTAIDLRGEDIGITKTGMLALNVLMECRDRLYEMQYAVQIGRPAITDAGTILVMWQ